MSAASTCQSCGHPNTSDAMFCSKCGSRTTPKAPKPAASAALTDGPTEAGRELSRHQAHGGSAVMAHPTDPELPEPAATEEPPEKQPEEPRREAPKTIRTRHVGASAKTMIGMGRPDPKTIRAARKKAAENRAAKAAAKDAAKRTRGTASPDVGGQGRTMLGVQAPDQKQIEHAVRQAQANREAKSQTQAEAGTPRGDGHKRPEAALDPTTNRTMLGQPAPRLPEDGQKTPAGLEDSPSGRERAPVMYPTNTGEHDAFTVPTRGPGKGIAIAALGVGAALLAIGGGALAWALYSDGPSIRASVVQGESGELLEIEVPGAESGTHVRFGGEEQPLEAGRARFPLSADALALGDNELSVDVVAPDGSTETEAVSLHLEMRVRADLGPLSRVPPAIEVIVEAPAGSQVALDGDALRLDGRGRATRVYVIDASEASADGVVEHVVRYRVQPPEGEASQGELRTRIPLTTLHLDRPGSTVVTDLSSVEFAGGVAPGATVTVGGAEATVTEGRFLHTLEVPEVGERTVEVIARAPGRAPRVERVRIRRVADLEAEAASFEFDEALTYARVAQDPATYRGQRVRFEGVVYNVVIRDGTSVVQMLVTECPAGQRCPVWITYPSATQAEVRSRIRVLGSIAGEQQFRSQSGEVRTVPRVDATFILEAPP